MSKKFKVIVNTGNPDNNQSVEVTQGQGGRGQPVRLQAKAGAKYQLLDLEKAKAVGPDYVKVKRVGKNLHILFENSTEADVIIEDYYEVMPEGYNGVVGQAENGNFYEYIPEDPDVKGLIPELADGGQAVSVALGGAEVVGSGAAIAILAFNPLLAGLGLLGAAAAAAAGGGGTTSTNTNNGSATALSIDPISSDNLISLAESGATSVTVTGKVTGKFAAGDVVTLKLHDKTYAAVVAADGTFSVVVSMADLKADADTKIEGTITGTGGSTATAAQDYQVETETTAGKLTALSIDPVTADNLVSAAENTGSINITGKVTGKFAAGDVVTLSVNGKPFTGSVNAQGVFSIPVPASDLVADSDTLVEGRVTGTGGTAANAIQDYALASEIQPTPGNNTALSINPITGDNLITVAEGGAASITVTGKVTGKFAAGDVVSLRLHDKTYAAVAAADGTFSVAVSMADLKADADTKIEGTVTGTGGNAASAAQDYQVETDATAGKLTALSIDAITADNIINAAENTGSINVTGKVAGAFAAGDVVTLTINGKPFNGS
uniref:Ig-like domain-containing protein n=1 Tax=Limnohabitans sp. TaxID=1907725 RepID=UPI0025BD9D2E